MLVSGLSSPGPTQPNPPRRYVEASVGPRLAALESAVFGKAAPAQGVQSDAWDQPQSQPAAAAEGDGGSASAAVASGAAKSLVADEGASGVRVPLSHPHPSFLVVLCDGDVGPLRVYPVERHRRWARGCKQHTQSSPRLAGARTNPSLLILESHRHRTLYACVCLSHTYSFSNQTNQPNKSTKGKRW